MRCCKRNTVMEGSMSGVLEQSFLYKDCCYFTFVFHLVMHPGFIFSSNSNSTRAILDGFSIRSVFSLVCMSEVVCFVYYILVWIKCCNCTLYYKMSSVIPYTPASVHSYLTCLCLTILIDISVLPDPFSWRLCITSDWGGYKTCPWLIYSIWGIF